MSPSAACLVALWAAWCVQALVCLLAARHFDRKMAEPERPGDTAFRPPVAVIMPIKGLADDPARAVSTVCRQDYPDYRMLFVLEAESDPAIDAVRAALTPRRTNARIVIAGTAPADRGQKVHNQLAALEALEADPRDGEVWVFVDSDAAPDPQWLGQLVGPLARPDTVVTTGYRYIMPPPGPGGARRGLRAAFWSHLASAMNASIATLQAHRTVTQAWGGAMAVRARDARAGDLRRRWRRAITDDYPMSRLAADAGSQVRFVSRCLVESRVDYGWRDLAEFVRRQYVITRAYAPRLLLVAVGAPLLYLTGAVTALGALAAGGGIVDPALPLIPLVLVHGANQLRSNVRGRALARIFDDAVLERLGPARWLDRWATPIWLGLHGCLAASALVGRHICWRGICYRVIGPESVRRLDG